MAFVMISYAHIGEDFLLTFELNIAAQSSFFWKRFLSCIVFSITELQN